MTLFPLLCGSINAKKKKKKKKKKTQLQEGGDRDHFTQSFFVVSTITYRGRICTQCRPKALYLIGMDGGPFFFSSSSSSSFSSTITCMQAGLGCKLLSLRAPMRLPCHFSLHGCTLHLLCEEQLFRCLRLRQLWTACGHSGVTKAPG